MKVSLAILLSLAVLAALFIPALEAAAMRRRGGRGRLNRGGRARAAPARRRMQARRGRQDDGAAAAAAPEGGEGEEGEDIPAWCNPEDPMGAWLLFKGVKLNCVGLGYEDFGRYGGVPAEDEEAEDSENAV